MFLIIAGCTQVGALLVKKFVDTGHNVVVIDRDKASFDNLETGCNCLMIHGMPIDEDVLKEAGIERADALIAVTAEDNMNIMISQIAKHLYHVPHVMMQANHPERQAVLSAMGLHMICPIALTADHFYTSLLQKENSI